jgi:hypothetical protein
MKTMDRTELQLLMVLGWVVFVGAFASRLVFSWWFIAVSLGVSLGILALMKRGRVG